MIFRSILLLSFFSLLIHSTVGCGILYAIAAQTPTGTGDNLRGQPLQNPFKGPADDSNAWNIPVLCYHAFYDHNSSRTPGPLDESYKAFEDMLHYLRSKGFRSFLPAVDPLYGEPDPQKVVITLDDGHVSQFRAAELLEKYDMRGIFFVIPSLIDAPDNPHMSAAQLSELASRGHLIGVHGHRHASMPAYGPEIIAVRDTVPGILKQIPGITDKNLHSLAFPFGHYTPAVKRSMRSRYPLQYTVNPGYWDGQSTLIPRILITRDTDRDFYYAYLSGAMAGPRVLTMREPNGSRQSVIHFENPGMLDPGTLYIRVVSPDNNGRHYDIRPATPFLSVDDRYGNVLVFDVSGFMNAYHPVNHRALSFVVTKKEKGAYRFVSDGYLIWVNRVDTD